MKIVFPFAVLIAWAMLAQPASAAMDEDARRDASNKIAGKRQYLEFCASCHGDTGGGDGPLAQRGTVPDFTTPQAVVTFDFERMSAGIAQKHDQKTRDGWKSGLGEGGAHIISFMREAFMLPAPTADASPGRALYARTCSVCHGERGNGASWAKNSLNPSPADFTAPKMRELSRRHMINTVTYGSPKTAMQGFSIRLSREEIAAVVDYVRSTFMAPGSIPGEGNREVSNLSYGNRMMSTAGQEGEGKHAQHGGHEGPADMDAPMPNGLAGDAAAGKEFFDKNCFVCHGKEGMGDGPRAYFIVPKPANLTSVEARVELNRPHLFASIGKGSQGTEMPAWSKVLNDQQIADVAEYVFVAFIQPPNKPSSKQTDKDATGQPEAQKKITDPLTLGRDVYNFRCYFCHGYGGDGRTVAADMLEPKPRNFTADPPLTAEKVTATLRHGVPGTAMKPFDQTLSKEEMSAVAAFVVDEFVTRKAPNTNYHTEANGWPDHQSRYGRAFPFVLGALDLDMPPIEMTDDQRRGRALYLDSCITCHEPKTSRLEFRAFPLSHMGQVIRDPVDHVSRASVYGMHDRPFEIAGLSPIEARGKEIYDQNCAFCHALNGTGKNWIGAFLEPHPRNLTDPKQTSHLSDSRLGKVIREGLEGTSMPAWAAVLNDSDIEATVTYLRKAFLGPEKRVSN